MSLVTLTQNPHGRIEGFLGPLGVDGVLLETRFGTLDSNHQICFQILTGGPRSREMVEKTQQTLVVGEGSEGNERRQVRFRDGSIGSIVHLQRRMNWGDLKGHECGEDWKKPLKSFSARAAADMWGRAAWSKSGL